jgi:hypothetical protein
MSEEKAGRRRRRRDRRDANPPPMRLTDRDREIIEAVCLHRVLRQDQVQALFFGSKSAAQRRLALLYHHGYLARQFLPVRGGIMNSPILYLLVNLGPSSPWRASSSRLTLISRAVLVFTFRDNLRHQRALSRFLAGSIG